MGRVALALLALSAWVFSVPALAQAQNARLPAPDILARLVWTTMIAVDNANRTENYSVLHALGSPGFLQRNSPSQLSRIFAGLREGRIDIGRAILVEPTYHIPPAITPDGLLRLRGGFEFRPRAIRFDILFARYGGGWRIEALSVAEMDSSKR